MELRLASAKKIIIRSLSIAILGSISLLIYLIYYKVVKETNNFSLQTLQKIWYLKFVLILPFWLMITYIKMKKGKKSGFVQSVVTSILLVPGIFVLFKLMNKDGFINPIEYIALLVAALFSIFLLRRLYIVQKYDDDIELGLLDFLFALFIIANFTMLNFYI